MAAFHLGPIQASEALAVADAFGFDPIYFLRVISPADALYREQITARFKNGHR